MFLLPRPKVEYKEFLPHVMANMQGDSRPALPPEAATSYVRSAAIMFAKDALVLEHEIRMVTQPGMEEYPLLLDDEEERVYLVYEYDGEWWPAYKFENDMVSLKDVLSDRDGEVNIKVAVVPKRKSCKVDERLFEEWHDAVVWQALSQLHKMPQRPWTSAGLSREYHQMYMAEVNRARRLEIQGHTLGPVRVQRNRGYI